MESTHFYLSKQGVYGDLFIPSEPKDKSKVMIVIGSADTGYDLTKATASGFASYGLCTFSMACWGVKGLSAYADRIPFELLSKARSLLTDRGFSKVGGYGIGKGAEYMLAAESNYRFLDFIIALSPSDYVHEGRSVGDLGSKHSSFTFRHEEVPYLKRKNILADIIRKSVLQVKMPGRKMFDDSYEAFKEEARIKVENIHVPILFLSSDNDPLWTGTEASKRMMERLNKNGHPEIHKHFMFESGQHLLFPEAYGLEKSLIKFAKGYSQAVAKTERASVSAVLNFVDEA